METQNSRGVTAPFAISDFVELVNKVVMLEEDGDLCCIIDRNLRNCYCKWSHESAVLIATPGVAASLTFLNFTKEKMHHDLEDRGNRCSGRYEYWYFVMHLEQAVNAVFKNDLVSFMYSANALKLDVTNKDWITLKENVCKHIATNA